MATSTLFPTRTGPKIGRLQPTAVIGQPMPPMQTIPEPVDMIGRYTGIRHAALGDNPNGPEVVHVTPSRPGPAVGDAPGETPYAAGGTFIVGGDPGTPQPSNSGASTTNDPITGAAPAGGPPPPPSWGSPWQDAPVYNPNGGGNPVYGPPAPPDRVDPNQMLYNARQRQLQAEQARLQAQRNTTGYQRNSIGAQRNVYNAETGTYGPQQAVYDAQGRVIQLSGQQNQMQRGYLQQEQAFNQQRAAELAAISAAKKNTPDLTRVAEAQNAYASENRRDSSLGVSAPAEVTLQPGQANNLPAGVRPKIRSQADVLTDQASENDQAQQAQLKIAQNIVSMQATDVAAARNAAEAAGLTLAEANQLVTRARNEAGMAGLDAQESSLDATDLGYDATQAGYDVQRLQLGEEGKVLYTDPYTGAGEYISQAEADKRKMDYQDQITNGRIGTTYDQQQRRTQYNNQQDPLGGLSVGAALAQLGDYVAEDQRAGLPFGSHLPAGFRERIRAAMIRDGWDPQIADQTIANALRPRGGGGTVITPPAFGGG